MSYCYRRQLKKPFAETLLRLREKMVYEGFGILYEIDVREIMREKMSKEFAEYRILGGCNPDYAYQALLAEPNIGAMFPCNTIIRETADGVEVAVADLAFMLGDTPNPSLLKIARNITDRLTDIVKDL